MLNALEKPFGMLFHEFQALIEVLWGMRLKGDGGVKAAFGERREKLLPRKRALAQTRMLIIAAVIVVQVQMAQEAFELHDPLAHSACLVPA